MQKIISVDNQQFRQFLVQIWFRKNGVYLPLIRTILRLFWLLKSSVEYLWILRWRSLRWWWPERLCLPLGVESHRVQVDFREGCKEGEQFVLEVVIRWNNVKEILDDADIVLCPAFVCSRIYPRAGHSRHIVRNDGIDLIPDAGVVTAGVSRESNDVHPRLKHGCVKEELLGHSFLVRRGEIPEYPCYVSEGEDFRQYLCRRIRIWVRVLEVYDKVLGRVGVFSLNKG